MLDSDWRPGVDFAAGMAAYYARREAHHRKLGDAAHRDWQEHHGLAEKYRLLADQAAAVENLVT